MTDMYDATLEADDRAVIEELQSVFEFDALETSTALSQEVLNPEYQAGAGGIQYTKGCSVIRMMQGFLTEEVFTQGLTAYLRDHKYDNADRYDLWAALNTTAHDAGILDASLDLADIMEFWTDRAGYPVVTVVNTTGPIVTLKQKRFFLDPEATDDLGTIWHIPIRIYYPSDGSVVPAEGAQWLMTEEADFSITDTPYVINYREDGYYRVNYQEDNWNALTELLLSEPGRIDRLNRAQIYDDSFNLARAMLLDYATPLEISKAVALEDDYIPLYSALMALQYLDGMLRQDETAYLSLKAYVTNLLADSYDSVGFDAQEDDSYLVVKRRNLLIEWLCMYGYEDCVANAVTKFDEWMEASDPDEVNPINVDQRRIIYEVALREGGDEEFDFLLDRLPEVKTAGEVINIIYGLGKTENVQLLKSLLDMTIDDASLIRSQVCKAKSGVLSS